MFDEEARDTRDSLNKTKRICRALKLITIVSLVLLVVFEFASVGFMVVAVLGNFGELDGNIGLLQISLSLSFGLVVAAILVILLRIFSDVAQGDSPFTMAQVKRLRIISLLLVCYGALDNIITNASALIQYNGFNSGYMSTNENAVFAVYLAPLIVAAAVFAFSYVFKYGVLLQKLSDETL